MSQYYPKYEKYFLESFSNFPIITDSKLHQECPCLIKKKEIYSADVLIPDEEIHQECCDKKTMLYYNVNKIKQPKKIKVKPVCQNYQETCIYGFEHGKKKKINCFSHPI